MFALWKQSALFIEQTRFAQPSLLKWLEAQQLRDLNSAVQITADLNISDVAWAAASSVIGFICCMI